jgi:hypothetical protein
MTALYPVEDGSDDQQDKEVVYYPAKTITTPNTVALPARGVFGLTRNSQDNTYRDLVVFSFQTELENVDLHFTAGGIDSEDELAIRLNGKQIGYAPLAKGAWGSRSVIHLPKSEVIKGGENLLVFDNTKNPPGFQDWAVRDVSIQVLSADLCDEHRARKLFELGEKMYEEKAISEGNLFEACRYYRDAAQLLRDCPPGNELYMQADTKMKRVTDELDALYTSLMFSFEKAQKMQDFLRARDILQTIVMHLPDPADDRHKKAVEHLEMNSRHLQLSK